MRTIYRLPSLLLCLVLVACTLSTPTPTTPSTATMIPPTTTTIPTSTFTLTLVPSLTTYPTWTSTATLSPTPVKAADLIFYNGTLITIEESQPRAEAIALRDGLIQAVGTDEQILTLEGPTTIMVDLLGQTMMPGFIDGHNHVLESPSQMGKSFNDAQDVSLQYGFTTVTQMTGVQEFLDTAMQAEQDGSLRLRVNVFPNYNASWLDENHHADLLKVWYPEHRPILDPQQYVRIPGIKIFVDGANNSERGCWALSEPFLPGGSIPESANCGNDWEDLYMSQEDMNQVVSQVQAAGYRVAFHAMGDRAIETALNAIEYALDGQSNEDYRHQIEHNSLARPDLLPRYEELGVLASVRGYGNFCDLSFLIPNLGEERTTWYDNRYELPGMDIHSYIETDFSWGYDPYKRFTPITLDPIMQLYGMVTHRYVNEDGSVCEPDPLVAAHHISIERALQMLTIEPAYAVSMEDYTGSLKPGKFADLIILSGNPFTIDPDALKDLRVWMTMVGGKVEWCAPGHEALCPVKLTTSPGSDNTELPTPTPFSSGKTLLVTSAADNGSGSLRQVLFDARRGDTITFDPNVFPPAHPTSIILISALPEITQGNLVIDGSDAGVILDGEKVSGSGFSISSNSNIIRGLQITGFSEAGIGLNGGAQFNIIGGDRDIGEGILGQGNLISGNGNFGIGLWDATTSHNTIQGNYIGITIDGERTWGHARDGIHSNGATQNLITDNIIGGNQGAGVYICCVENGGYVVTNNFIGVGLNGNALSNVQAGVILDRTSYNLIGPGNMIAYNLGGSIALWEDAPNNTITQNSIRDN